MGREWPRARRKLARGSRSHERGGNPPEGATKPSSEAEARPRGVKPSSEAEVSWRGA
jgi:hypothetical protein